MGSGSPPVALRIEAWNNVFQGEEFELPETEFMNHLQKSLPDEQFLQLIKDVKGSLIFKKTGFYETNYETTQEAKTQLLALFTEIMMTETGFVIDQ